MMAAYFKTGQHRRPCVFEYFYRQAPFGGLYTVFVGLHAVIDYLLNLRFTEEHIAYLRSLTSSTTSSWTTCAIFRFTGVAGIGARGRSPAAARARDARDSAARRGPVDRDGAAQPGQLPDADRHQSLARQIQRRRQNRHGIRPAPRPGRGRRADRLRGPRTSAARLDQQRRGGLLLRHPVWRHARAQLRHVLPGRGDRLRALRRHLSAFGAVPGRYLRHLQRA